ncbi:MAG: lytic murein transglycosylase [Proteobacteria bacterium]|nr:lytic murein transglycosylase [Pseudomonadota bacterium]
MKKDFARSRKSLGLAALVLVALFPVIASASTVIKKGTPNTAQFDAWLKGVREEALQQGISEAAVEEGLSDVRHIEKVIRLDRKQPEKTRTHDEYLKLVITPERIARGRALMAENKQLLDAISAKYGVQPRFIVALWGIETSYGKITGDYSIIDALATLAYDGRRADFFRTELLNALRILDAHDVDKSHLRGSWAGAMGQTQFMPSSFLSFAQDYDGDGRRDIWNTQADVFASIANYLSKSGWNINETWGREVKLPQGFDFAANPKGTEKTLAEWEALGVRNVSGGKLPNKALTARLSLPGGEEGRAYLLYGNNKVIMKWNRSDYFATAVGTLADALGH